MGFTGRLPLFDYISPYFVCWADIEKVIEVISKHNCLFDHESCCGFRSFEAGQLMLYLMHFHRKGD